MSRQQSPTLPRHHHQHRRSKSTCNACSKSFLYATAAMLPESTAPRGVISFAAVSFSFLFLILLYSASDPLRFFSFTSSSVVGFSSSAFNNAPVTAPSPLCLKCVPA